MKAYLLKSGHLRLSLNQRDKELLLTLLRFTTPPVEASELVYFEQRLRIELAMAEKRKEHRDNWEKT